MFPNFNMFHLKILKLSTVFQHSLFSQAKAKWWVLSDFQSPEFSPLHFVDKIV